MIHSIFRVGIDALLACLRDSKCNSAANDRNVSQALSVDVAKILKFLDYDGGMAEVAKRFHAEVDLNSGFRVAIETAKLISLRLTNAARHDARNL